MITITLVNNFPESREPKVARFAVVLTEQNDEKVWVFETRTEALKWFNQVKEDEHLESFEAEGKEFDQTFLESHAFGYEGQQLFVVPITGVDR